MSKIKVAILDSGIAECCLDNEDIMNMACNNIDDNGHGTMCYSLIRAMAPDSILYISKVLDRNLLGSFSKLIDELEKLVDMDINIINLSLSTENALYIPKINSICKKLYTQGKIIVAAQNNMPNVNSYPCFSPYVTGVNGGIFDSNYDYIYQSTKQVQAIANKVPYLEKSMDNKYHFFGGNSKATACMTGIISRYWNTIGCMSQKERAKNLEVKSRNQNECKSFINKIDSGLRNKIECFVEREFHITPINNENEINESEVCNFLKRFENLFEIKINFESVSLLTLLDKKTVQFFC